MKIFSCQHCGNVVYFENTSCERCGAVLGYLPECEVLSAVTPNGRVWTALADADHRYRFCVNWELNACNWLVDADADSIYCLACQHNHAIPDVSNPARHVQWQKIEEAKRRLFYSLIKFRLPTSTSRCREPLVFQFLDDMPNRKQIMTGHDNGVITVALREADDGEREKLRVQMGETYRTLLGHFRHEVGHYYWDVLVRDRGLLEQFRSMFGDERHDYSKAMEHYYRTGAPADWRDAFISPYASMHPWEDFAETWAHYIHIVDALEMAHAFGVRLAPRTVASVALSTGVDTNPYRMSSIAAIIEDWLPVCTAVNNLNRAMGQPDLYPFVLSAKSISKIGYVHQIIRAAAGEQAVASHQ